MSTTLQKSEDTAVVGRLGGFQDAANALSALAGHVYTRQGVHQLWKRRESNGFPDQQEWLINGFTRHYLDLDEVTDWYAFPEAAALLTRLARILYNSADVYQLWLNREETLFPDLYPTFSDPGARTSFRSQEVVRWYEALAPERQRQRRRRR